MSTMLQAPIGKLIPDDVVGRTSCAYPPGEAGSWSQAEIAIEWDDRGGPTLGEQMKSGFGASAVGRQVAHAVALGDEAVYSREGVLTVRHGKALITVTLPMRADSEAKATAIGQKLLDRLGWSVAAVAGPKAALPADRPAAKPDPVLNETEDALKGLMALFGDDDKAKEKKEATPVPAAAAPASLPYPQGFEPDGSCPDPGPSADAELAAAAAGTIPLEEGLTLASTWTNPKDSYEHECLKQITRIDHFAVTVTMSCPTGADRKMETATRRLCRVDLRDSYLYETAFSRDLPETMRGALSLSLSAKSFSELTTSGRTRHRFLELASPRNGLPMRLVADNDGEVERQGTGISRVIVNDRALDLPVVEASGRYTRNGKPDTFLLKVLDVAALPIVLEYRHGGDFSITYTKISFPTTGEMEKHLAADKHVDVYGIYFDFASDRLRPESGPVLREISEALTKNPTWVLTINGHTDNVGGDAFNLDLSRRRSLSVRQALAQTYRIDPARLSTAGLGAAQPKASNATADGRAKNRRVELVRQ